MRGTIPLITLAGLIASVADPARAGAATTNPKHASPPLPAATGPIAGSRFSYRGADGR